MPSGIDSTSPPLPPGRGGAEVATPPAPVGIFAALLAMAIAGGAASGARLYAGRLAARHVRIASMGEVPFKYQTLTLQRAALASGQLLPIYGSSELSCCGSPYRATQVFASRPTGFGVLAVGRAGTADLFFAETFAALGRDLEGKAVVVSDSPPWFYARRALTPADYTWNLLPEITYTFVFDAPVSAHVRKVGASRMLANPEMLQSQPLLRLAVTDLARPSLLHRAEFAALAPLGRLATRVLQTRDAVRTIAFTWQERSRAPDPPPLPRAGGWVALARHATRIAERRDTTNPFGFTDATYRQLRPRPNFQRALALYRSGQTNRDGELLPPPEAWEAGVASAVEWTDLRLALRVLRALRARPLVWTLPMPGVYDNYTPRSAAARRRYYERYEHLVEQAKVPWLDFRSHDEDRYFVTDPGSHLSPRGWVFADRALDLFWHGRSIGDIRTALAALARRVPPPASPWEASQRAPERRSEG